VTLSFDGAVYALTYLQCVQYKQCKTVQITVQSTVQYAYPAVDMLSGRSRKQRLRRSPDHSWTPMIPNMKKTKKHSIRTLPSIGSVSSNNVTNNKLPKNFIKMKRFS